MKVHDSDVGSMIGKSVIRQTGLNSKYFRHIATPAMEGSCEIMAHNARARGANPR